MSETRNKPRRRRTKTNMELLRERDEAQANVRRLRAEKRYCLRHIKKMRKNLDLLEELLKGG